MAFVADDIDDDLPFGETEDIDLDENTLLTRHRIDDTPHNTRYDWRRGMPPSRAPKRQRGTARTTQLLIVDTDTIHPSSDGYWPCKDCDAIYDSRTGIVGHMRFCIGGAAAWACEWCGCGGHETTHKTSGPSGPKTLCTACGQRHRAGHNGPPLRDEAGNFLCDQCNRSFPTFIGLGGHKRFCDSGVWHCEWCNCTADETTNKGTGPNGTMTLCSTCSQRYRGGHSRPPPRDADGKYVCPICNRGFQTMAGLGTHKSRCDGGKWRCGWCDCSHEQSQGKGPGPDGNKTLCTVCSARWRAGHTEAPKMDEKGQFLCKLCQRPFATFAAKGVHERTCQMRGWKCRWCGTRHSKGCGEGPDGVQLCSSCVKAAQAGGGPPPELTEQGRFLCTCRRTYDSMTSLTVHKRHCLGGDWACEWCKCKERTGHKLQKGKGPNGPRTLCAACSQRYRHGHQGPPSLDSEGRFLCECERAFESMSGLGSHRRFCEVCKVSGPQIRNRKCQSGRCRRPRMTQSCEI